LFQVIELSDVVRVPPAKFGEPLQDVAKEILKQKYESLISPDLGYVILIMSVKADEIGKVIPGDGSTYHKSKVELLTFMPKIQEVVEGEVLEITDFGAFVRRLPDQRRKARHDTRKPEQ
jgi:DNA-directed RNA polymerase subunit E'